MNKRSYNLIVIGSGPAGLMGAVMAARAGASVLVLEKMSKVGVKLLSTGGGRCNLSNTLSPEEFMKAFGRQGRFMQDALRQFGRAELCQFLEQLGLETIIEEPFIFPATGGAQAVLDCLLNECDRHGIEIQTNCEVTGLLKDGGVKTSKGSIQSNAVLLATGGKGYSALGGSDSGFTLARKAGHTITNLLPGDVPLVTEENWPKQLSGISLSDISLRVMLKGFPKASVRGDLLFTHHGISGPMVINQSSAISEALQKTDRVPLQLCLAEPGDWRKQAGNKTIANALRPWFPSALTKVLCENVGLDPETPASKTSDKQAAILAEHITRCPLTIIETEGFEKAMVTRGGIQLKEVDPATMESKVFPSLYVAGEALNLDGPCGGFNLQWAFASGCLAGLSAFKRNDK